MHISQPTCEYLTTCSPTLLPPLISHVYMCINILRDHRGTLFGEALIYALKGGAASPDNPLVTTEMLFEAVSRRMKEILAKSKGVAFKAPNALTDGGQSEQKGRKGRKRGKKKKKAKKKKKKPKKAASEDEGVASSSKKSGKSTKEVPVEEEEEEEEEDEDDENIGPDGIARLKNPHQSPTLVVPSVKGVVNIPHESSGWGSSNTKATAKKDDKPAAVEDKGNEQKPEKQHDADLAVTKLGSNKVASGTSGTDQETALVKNNKKDEKNKNKDHNTIVEAPFVSSRVILNAVSLRCSPPPAPLKPTFAKVGLREVLLKWENPPFNGAPPLKYRVYIRNGTRNFRKWTLIEHPGDITKQEFWVLHLPSTLECEFAVSACNNGGWGVKSESSGLVCPGADLKPLPAHQKTSRLNAGGVLTALDRLAEYKFHRSEQLWGMERLLAFATVDRGYKKGNMQKRAAEACFHALKEFPDDSEVIALALSLLGWTLLGPAKSEVVEMCMERKLPEECVKYMKAYRSNGKIIGAVSWLRCGMPKGAIAQPVPMDVVLYKHVKTAEEELADTDDEEG
jgi:hypothetical protein